MHKVLLLISVVIIFATCAASLNKVAPIVVSNGTIGKNVSYHINSTTELTYWFTGNVTTNIGDLTINVDCSVDSNTRVKTPVRFDVQWKDVIEQPAGTWLLPLELVGDSVTSTYNAYNSTLCSSINGNYTSVTKATVKVTVSTTSITNVNFVLKVYFDKSIVMSEFQPGDHRLVDITVFSPVYFKLKFNESVMSGVEFGELDIWSNDSSADVCMTVALWSPDCPLIQRETDAEMKRHLTMSRNATVTIKAQDLLQGRFLVFILNDKDSKCQSKDEMKNEILPTVKNSYSEHQLRQKRFYITLRKKIAYDQYYYAIILTLVIICTTSCFLFIIAFCVLRNQNWGETDSNSRCSTPVSVENEHDAENGRNSFGNDENERLLSGESTLARNRSYSPSQSSSTSISSIQGDHNDDGQNVIADTENGQNNDNERPENQRRFWILEKNYTNNPVPTDSTTENTNQYSGTLVVLAIYYILPAVQLIWVYQRFYKITGNKDICYFNFKCLHPFLGLPAFNHLFSNIGYLFMGLVFILVVLLDSSGKDKGIFVAMGVSLIVQGVMSGLYHDCPNQISFQFDTSFMYITAVLLASHVYQKQHPGAKANAILSYVVAGIAVLLGITAVVSRVRYFWFVIVAVHISICALVSCQLDAVYGGYSWEFVSPRNVSLTHITSSFTQPFHLKSFSWVKRLLVLFNIFNWVVAGSLVTVWILRNSQDFATYMLLPLLSNLLLFSVGYGFIKVRDRTLPMRSSVTLLLTILLVGIAAGWFYLDQTASWSVSPAESRIINQDCILFEFYDTHDVWHFLSAFAMFLIFLLFFILDGKRVDSSGRDARSNDGGVSS